MTKETAGLCLTGLMRSHRPSAEELTKTSFSFPLLSCRSLQSFMARLPSSSYNSEKSWKREKVPNDWRKASVTSILKQGKKRT